ncbi:MAG: hypothetical protein ACM3OA_01645 [Acidobacteriota bacterium]
MKMEHTCSKVLLAVLGISLYGCDNASNPTAVRSQTPVLRAGVTAVSPNATVKFTDSFPFSFFNECTGDTVSGVVNVKSTVHISTSASGGFRAQFHDVYLGRAVGEPSGTSYVGPQTDHDGFGVSSGGAAEETFTENFRFLSQGSADNILTHVLFHTTINANGVVTSETATITDACKG